MKIEADCHRKLTSPCTLTDCPFHLPGTQKWNSCARELSLQTLVNTQDIAETGLLESYEACCEVENQFVRLLREKFSISNKKPFRIKRREHPCKKTYIERHGEDIRVCPICGITYSTFVGNPSATCSRKCGGRWRREGHRAVMNDVK